mgnify:CR=1 FL=1
MTPKISAPRIFINTSSLKKSFSPVINPVKKRQPKCHEKTTNDIVRIKGEKERSSFPLEKKMNQIITVEQIK